MKRFFAVTICGLLFAGVLPNLYAVQGNGNGHGKGHNKQFAEDDNERKDGRNEGGGVRVVFTVHDREVIRDYYHQNSNLPPGLAKRNGDLPPGLQKHLERDGTLPPGLQKRVQPFPQELERRLPPLPGTYARVTLGVDILILDRRTQRIIDVVRDILRP